MYVHIPPFLDFVELSAGFLFIRDSIISWSTRAVAENRKRKNVNIQLLEPELASS